MKFKQKNGTTRTCKINVSGTLSDNNTDLSGSYIGAGANKEPCEASGTFDITKQVGG